MSNTKEITELNYEQGNLLCHILKNYSTQNKENFIKIQDIIKSKEVKTHVSQMHNKEILKNDGYSDFFFNLLSDMEANGTKLSDEIKKNNSDKDTFDMISYIQKAVKKETDTLVLGQDFLLTDFKNQSVSEVDFALKGATELQENVLKINNALGALWFSYWKSVEKQ